MSWYLRREWVDQEPGIDDVVIHYTFTPRGQGPDWARHCESRQLQDLGGYRKKIVAMPREVWSDQEGRWVPEYRFHYFFEVFGQGRQWVTDLHGDDIVSRELEFVDHDGLITNICVHWAVGDWEAPTYSPMEDPRFPADSEFASIRYYGYWDKPRFHHAKAKMLEALPLPHVWRARIWGPHGSSVLQQYHIGRMYPEHEQREVFLGPDGPTHEFGSSWVHPL